jgi:hypothetical protein
VRWLGLVVFAALPLQWFVVGGTPLGLMRLHQAVLLLVTMIILVVRPLRTNAAVLRAAAPFVVLNLVMLTVWAGISLFNGEIPRTPVQELIYLGVFVVLGTYLSRAASGEEPGALPLLRWTAVAAVVTLILAFAVSMVGNGVNPLGVLRQAIATADPEYLQKQFFKSSFVGYGYDAETVRGNIRHEVFGGLLAAMYVAVWAERLMPGPPGAARTLRRVALVVGTGMLLISMSRAVLIAAAVWPLLGVWRSVRRFEVSTRQLTLIYVTLAGFGVLLLSGIARVLWIRFTQDTQSYQSRGGLYDRAFANIADNFWTGGVETTGESSHNFVVDAWLRGGVLVALAAAGVILVLLVSWGVAVVRLPREPVWMVPVAAAFALPLDRMLTSGGGLIPPVSWVTLAFIAGVFAFRRQQAVRGENRAFGVPPPPREPAPGPVP